MAAGWSTHFSRSLPGSSGAGLIIALPLFLGTAGILTAGHGFSADCSVIESDAERLRCYDEASSGTSSSPPAAPPSSVPSAPAPTSKAALPSPLGKRWELDPGTRERLFSIKPHKQNYLLVARYSTNVNNDPQTPTRAAPGSSLDLDNTEAKFQISLKAKAFGGLFGDRLALWFGYTQQSHWQVYNASASRPFRETNYEPEAMLVWRTDVDILGLRSRFINFGFVHQSNGRGEPLSRSWNRVYAQFGFERAGFALLVRPWLRIREQSTVDDNPDMTDYLGHGDLVAVYQWGGHTVSLLARSNFDFSDLRGAIQADWSFPLAGVLKGYVQVFHGYGESLIDYNHSQTTIGAGILLANWM